MVCFLQLALGKVGSLEAQPEALPTRFIELLRHQTNLQLDLHNLCFHGFRQM